MAWSWNCLYLTLFYENCLNYFIHLLVKFSLWFISQSLGITRLCWYFPSLRFQRKVHWIHSQGIILLLCQLTADFHFHHICFQPKSQRFTQTHARRFIWSTFSHYWSYFCLLCYRQQSQLLRHYKYYVSLLDTSPIQRYPISVISIILHQLWCFSF